MTNSQGDGTCRRRGQEESNTVLRRDTQTVSKPKSPSGIIGRLVCDPRPFRFINVGILAFLLVPRQILVFG